MLGVVVNGVGRSAGGYGYDKYNYGYSYQTYEYAPKNYNNDAYYRQDDNGEGEGDNKGYPQNRKNHSPGKASRFFGWLFSR